MRLVCFPSESSFLFWSLICSSLALSCTATGLSCRGAGVWLPCDVEGCCASSRRLELSASWVCAQPMAGVRRMARTKTALRISNKAFLRNLGYGPTNLKYYKLPTFPYPKMNVGIRCGTSPKCMEDLAQSSFSPEFKLIHIIGPGQIAPISSADTCVPLQIQLTMLAS
jgi:hypothetical protein